MNNNGIISFLKEVSPVHPVAFRRQGPLRGSGLLGGRGQPARRGRVLPGRRPRTRPPSLRKATADVRRYFPELPGFSATWVFVATWYRVTFFGRQCVFPRRCSILRGGHPSGAQGLPPGPTLLGWAGCHPLAMPKGTVGLRDRSHLPRSGGQAGRQSRDLPSSWKPPASGKKAQCPDSAAHIPGETGSVGAFNRSMMAIQEMCALSVNITVKISHE